MELQQLVAIFCLIHYSYGAVLTCGQSKTLGKSTRIVGGTEAKPHAVPWIVSFRFRSEHFCGGSLVRVNSMNQSDIVVTAAHCLADYVKLRNQSVLTGLVMGATFPVIDVYLGAHYLSKQLPGEIKLRIADVKMHNNFSSPIRNANDVAIVRLSTAVSFSDTIQPVCLPDQDEMVADGTNGIVAGWGHLKQGADKLSETLQQVTAPVIASEICQKNYGASVQPTTMICAGYGKGEKDSCQNDSGGPYMIKSGNGFVLQGLVSFGEGCAKAGKPGVYTRVSKFTNWLKDGIKEMSLVKE